MTAALTLMLPGILLFTWLILIALDDAKTAAWIARLGTFLTAAVSAALTFFLYQSPQPVHLTIAEWIELSAVSMPIALTADLLAAVALTVVTTTGFLLLFCNPSATSRTLRQSTFALLAAVVMILADDLLTLFAGGQLIQFALLGLNREYPGAKLRFLLGRCCDLCFLFGILLAWWHFDSLRYDDLASEEWLNESLLDVRSIPATIGLALTVGLAGRIGLFPASIGLADSAGRWTRAWEIGVCSLPVLGIILHRSGALFLTAGDKLATVPVIGAFAALASTGFALFQDESDRDNHSNRLAFSAAALFGIALAGVNSPDGIQAVTFLLLWCGPLLSILFLFSAPTPVPHDDRTPHFGLIPTTTAALLISGCLGGAALFDALWNIQQGITAAKGLLGFVFFPFAAAVGRAILRPLPPRDRSHHVVSSFILFGVLAGSLLTAQHSNLFPVERVRLVAIGLPLPIALTGLIVAWLLGRRQSAGWQQVERQFDSLVRLSRTRLYETSVIRYCVAIPLAAASRLAQATEWLLLAAIPQSVAFVGRVVRHAFLVTDERESSLFVLALVLTAAVFLAVFMTGGSP